MLAENRESGIDDPVFWDLGAPSIYLPVASQAEQAVILQFGHSLVDGLVGTLLAPCNGVRTVTIRAPVPVTPRRPAELRLVKVCPDCGSADLSLWELL